MSKEKVVRLGFLIIALGIILKFFHIGGAWGNTVTMFSLIVIFAYVIIAIFEVNNSGSITPKEKILWTIALIFFNALAGLIYFLIARPRILGRKQI